MITLTILLMTFFPNDITGAREIFTEQMQKYIIEIELTGEEFNFENFIEQFY